MIRCLFFTFIALFFLPVMIFAQEFVVIDDPDSPVNQASIRGFYRGCAWADIDDDGDLDLSMEGHLFRNEGNDNFTRVESFGTAPEPGATVDFLGGVSWADYDNDGDLDCLYSTSSGFSGVLKSRTFIYDNDGTGIFTEKLVETDTSISLKTWSAAFGNYNNDGFIDVVGAVAFGFLSGTLDTPGFFYKGNVDGSFTKIDTFEFAMETAPYTVAFWSDYDEDGDSDLFLAAGPGGSPGPDFHYKNMLKETGTEGLVRITDQPFATDPQDGQNYNFIDYDLDGDLDMYLTNYGGAPNRFYENDGGTYTSITNELVFAGPMLGNCWGDFDNDGDQDVLITSDNVNSAGYFRNDDGVFVKVNNPFDGIFPTTGNVSGLTIGDYDNDGDLDFFANGGLSGLAGPKALYRNDLNNSNHWINITCEGSPSNRAAIGTRLQLKATINGTPVWLKREISAQNTFMGHNSLRAHFGIGDATVVDSLILHWPSGLVETYVNLAVDDFYSIMEGDAVVGTKEPIAAPVSLVIIPNPAASDEVQVLNVFEKNGTELEIQILDINGRVLKTNSLIGSGEWITINTNTLTNGIYLIRMKANDREAVGRLVIQRG